MPTSNSDARVLQTPGILANNLDLKGSYQRMNPTIENGFVYLIQIKDQRFTKIGFSARPQQRHLELQVASPYELVLARVYPGTKDTEGWFHAMFTEFHRRGEWFSVSPCEVDRVVADYGLRGQLLKPFVAQYERPKEKFFDLPTELAYTHGQSVTLWENLKMARKVIASHRDELTVLVDDAARMMESLAACRRLLVQPESAPVTAQGGLHA